MKKKMCVGGGDYKTIGYLNRRFDNAGEGGLDIMVQQLYF